jgi:hypothetical protein
MLLLVLLYPWLAELFGWCCEDFQIVEIQSRGCKEEAEAG